VHPAAESQNLPRRREPVAGVNVHFSKASDLWGTPQRLFDELHAIFRFDLDVCALPENAKCSRFFTPADDGLAQDWSGTVFMNPPFSQIEHWLRKALESSLRGVIVVCLVPARPGSGWWNDFVTRGDITFLRRRLKFGGAKNGAPFPSALVVFGSRKGAKRYAQCVVCDSIFATTRAHAETCSGACRVRRHRKRRRGAALRLARAAARGRR
jgi:phage N-6-adenine-methyltransferase